MSTKEAAREEAVTVFQKMVARGEIDNDSMVACYYGFDEGCKFAARDQWTECPNCKSGIADGYLEIINERDTDGGEIDLVGCPVCDHEWEQPYQQGGE